MDITLLPSAVSGTVQAISSKSYAHRLLIAAALADAPTEIRINAFSVDIDTTIDCLNTLGATITKTESGVYLEPLSVKNRTDQPLTIDCKESGSTARFLLPVASFLCSNVTLMGSGRLPSRPFSSLCREMSKHGTEFNGEYLPLTAKTPNVLQSGTYCLEGNISSQYISALLFVLPLLKSESRIEITSTLESAAYIDMTLEVLALFGIVVTQEKNTFIIPGNQTYKTPKASCSAEGDWSNSAFFLAMGALGNGITVCGLKTNSAQGDRAIALLLEQFGSKVTENDESVTVEGLESSATNKLNYLHGIEIDASQIPDLVPCLAVVASVARGTTRIYNAARLRLKESDRLKTTVSLLSALGANIREDGDGLIIEGKESLDGGTVNGENDHRIVMSAAVASTVCKNPVTILGSQAVQKSYPAFFADLALLGCRINTQKGEV